MRRRPMARPARGLVRTAGRTAVIAGTATAVSGRVAQNQAAQAQQAAEAQAYREAQAAAAAAPPPPQPAPAPAPEPAAAPVDVVGQLTQLAALRDQGVLTDAEFEAQKAKILSL